MCGVANVYNIECAIYDIWKRCFLYARTRVTFQDSVSRQFKKNNFFFQYDCRKRNTEKPSSWHAREFSFRLISSRQGSLEKKKNVFSVFCRRFITTVIIITLFSLYRRRRRRFFFFYRWKFYFARVNTRVLYFFLCFLFSSFSPRKEITKCGAPCSNRLFTKSEGGRSSRRSAAAAQ